MLACPASRVFRRFLDGFRYDSRQPAATVPGASMSLRLLRYYPPSHREALGLIHGQPGTH